MFAWIGTKDYVLSTFLLRIQETFMHIKFLFIYLFLMTRYFEMNEPEVIEQNRGLMLIGTCSG